ncbi:MAG TPA: flavodoxin family protein [Methanoregulaceae archaeon]|jgi:multimeric flavodoxin WrbA|nr:flavodoxin family protein [Methanolinea sp.]MCC7567889.1 flavodoxin family protein [Methanoregulaceae archaeon]MDD3091065.1 flavodoxin family protein [Methanoregulaceae archaeon]MDD5049160.1 flavodoxin family protein [Methanoregulaceae archaeon]MDD5684311.1 flavodoxin family protein [Methanoregulaceae archaeon]
MAIKVLAFAGSPRRGGNSETLLDWVLDAMKKEGDVEIEKIALTEADVHPCKGCNACEVLNKCVQRDGMDILHDKIIEADCMVLAAPIYCMGICSQAKALIDRFQVFRSRKFVLKLPVVPPERKGKRLGVFLSTAGQDWDHVFNGAVPSVKCFYHVVEIRDADIHYLMINNVDEKGAILNHPSAKADAERLGHDVIRELQGRLSE